MIYFMSALAACWCLIAPTIKLHLGQNHSSSYAQCSNIVNGHKLLCDAYTVLEQHRGTAALLFY